MNSPWPQPTSTTLLPCRSKRSIRSRARRSWKALKVGDDRLGQFIVVLVAHPRRLEGAVPDEPAARAEAHADVAPRAIQSFRARGHQLDLMHRNAGPPRRTRARRGRRTRGRREGRRRDRSSVLLSCWPTCGSRTACRHTMRGWGIGMMKRPPRARYSVCCSRISSAKFQVSSSVSSGWSASSCSTGRIASLLPGM